MDCSRTIQFIKNSHYIYTIVSIALSEFELFGSKAMWNIAMVIDDHAKFQRTSGQWIRRREEITVKQILE